MNWFTNLDSAHLKAIGWDEKLLSIGMDMLFDLLLFQQNQISDMSLLSGQFTVKDVIEVYQKYFHPYIVIIFG